MITEILQHKIDYWFRDEEDLEMDECNMEHIEKMIIDGYSSGELCQYDQEEEKEYSGWWEIVK